MNWGLHKLFLVNIRNTYSIFDLKIRRRSNMFLNIDHTTSDSWLCPCSVVWSPQFMGYVCNLCASFVFLIGLLLLLFSMGIYLLDSEFSGKFVFSSFVTNTLYRDREIALTFLHFFINLLYYVRIKVCFGSDLFFCKLFRFASLIMSCPISGC